MVMEEWEQYFHTEYGDSFGIIVNKEEKTISLVIGENLAKFSLADAFGLQVLIKGLRDDFTKTNQHNERK
jgi:hypothetical protein